MQRASAFTFLFAFFALFRGYSQFVFPLRLCVRFLFSADTEPPKPSSPSHPDSLQPSIEDQYRIAFVDPELSSRESAFLGNPNRRVMLWVNQAGHRRRSKVFTSPIQHCLHRLGRIA